MQGNNGREIARYTFGEFVADVAAGELLRAGRRLRLQEKPFQLLMALLERPGQVLTREELSERLWPGGIHVDYEQGLGNAVQKLRQALCDSAESPRYVETVPRRGYRFLAPVASEHSHQGPVAPSETQHSAAAGRLRWPARTTLFVAGALLAAGLLLLVTFRAGTPNTSGALTRDPEAWEAYLRARHFEENKTPESMPKSVEYFRQAIVEDPQFAMAWAGLADAYRFMGALSLLSREEAYHRSSQAARRALELDENLGEAHAALAETTFRFGSPDADVGPGFRRALELRPDSATIRQWHANYLASRGRPEEALEEMQRAQRMDPLSLHINADLSVLLYNAGLHAEAREQIRRTLELDANYPKAHFLVGYMEWEEQHFDEAVAAFRRVNELAPDTPKFLHALALACADGGRREEARQALRQMKALQGRRYVEPQLIAQVEQRLAHRAEHDAAP